MSQIGVILALLFSLIIALFALANQQPVNLNYLYGETEVSAIVVILGSSILGALVIFLLSLFRHIKMTFKVRSLSNELNTLKENIQSLEEEKDALINQVELLSGQAKGEFAEGESGAASLLGEESSFTAQEKDAQELIPGEESHESTDRSRPLEGEQETEEKDLAQEKEEGRDDKDR